LVVVAATCGVFVTLYWVPSIASRRHPRQKASGCWRRVAIGRSARRIKSAKTSHGRRIRRSDHELLARGSWNNSKKCSAKVPAPCIT
jgi:hypothetical protein